MSVLGIDEALAICEAQTANRSKVAADSIVILLDNKDDFNTITSKMSNEEALSLRNQIGRIIREIYE